MTAKTKMKYPMAISYMIISVYGFIMVLLIRYTRISSKYEDIRIRVYCIMLIIGLIVTLAIIVVIRNSWICCRIKTDQICRIIIYAGVIVRILYVLFSSIYMRQNDVLTMEESGHLGYICYVYVFGKPPVPGTGWEFTQPPLWYYICAVWLRLGMKVLTDFEALLESLQTLSLLFSVGITIVFDRILVEIDIDDRDRITANIFSVFYPYMIFMSGAINNDCAATFFSMLTVLYAIKWTKGLGIEKLMVTSLFFGLSLACKFSSIVLGPGLAIAMIYCFFKDRRTIRCIAEYGIFTIISSSIGLSWPIYSRVAYGIPFGYINNASTRHVGNHSTWELLFSFENQLNHYYLNVVENSSDYDFNIFSTIIKSGTYGVDNFMSDNIVLRIVGFTLLWVNILLAVCLVVCSLLWTIKYNKTKQEVKLLICSVIWVSIALLYGRAIYSAYTCNMELRFMLPAFLCMICSAGLYMSDNKKQNRGINWFENIYGYGVILMSFLSISMWSIVLTIRDYDSIRMIIGY